MVIEKQWLGLGVCGAHFEMLPQLQWADAVHGVMAWGAPSLSAVRIVSPAFARMAK